MTLIDVALVTLLFLIATGLWWLGAVLQERERRKTEREIHDLAVERNRRAHALQVEQMERQSYLRRRETITQTVELGQRLNLHGEHMREMAAELRDEIDPPEPWKDGH